MVRYRDLRDGVCAKYILISAQRYGETVGVLPAIGSGYPILILANSRLSASIDTGRIALQAIVSGVKE